MNSISNRSVVRPTWSRISLSGKSTNGKIKVKNFGSEYEVIGEVNNSPEYFGNKHPYIYVKPAFKRGRPNGHGNQWIRKYDDPDFHVSNIEIK